ncbi:MAG: tetratricopeptide (TPR) repeat protein [Psychromonas sp.]|jgi:tetratricopeptide (TPR) repeat protein|uniref:tetratricopeptide repeat protein n=1 Tax=Psychromonas sp. TaxID=1884585 RepID=UPI0039E3059B
MNIVRKISLLCMPWVLVACSTLPTRSPVEEVISPPTQGTQPKEEVPEAPVVKPQEPSVDSAAIAPPAVFSLLRRAELQEQNGDNRSAASSLERAIRMAPRYPGSYYRLGELRYREGAYRQAVSLAQKTLSLGAEGILRQQAQDLLKKARAH